MAQDLLGQPIVDIVVEQERVRVVDPVILNLIQTRVGQPLSMVAVRQTVDHLLNLQRFDDIQPIAEPAPGGVRLRYVVVPSHPIDRIEFAGNVALSESDLRRILTDRFGRSPNPQRGPEMVTALRGEYRRRGYPASAVTPRIEPTHNPHRATLVFDIDAGRRARITDVQFINIDNDPAAFTPPQIRVGDAYDQQRIDDTLAQWVERLRAQGYYQARATHGAEMPDDAFVRVNLGRGPLVMLEFAGDPLPADERDRLVPVRAQGSTDEDLLEDSKLAIEQYFRARGYRDAVANISRDDTTPGRLTITFTIARGPHYTIDSVRIIGNREMSSEELQKIVTLAPGQEFVGATLDAQRAAVQAEYIRRGFTRAQIKADTASLPPENPGSTERRVEVTLAIDEGARTIVRRIAFMGNASLPESQLRAAITLVEGAPFLSTDVVDARDLLAIRYRNRGYVDVVVRPDTTFAENGTQADVTFTITEGPQVIVEHIIITGTEKTKDQTVLDELEIREGEPLGEAAISNSRTKLARLGLFRRIDIRPVVRPGESMRDVIVQLEEADRTTFGFGGGVEATLRARPTGEGGVAEDNFEVAPRGSFEIGRRNLWGSNRSVNLFTRVSLRATDILRTDAPATGDQTESNLGFNEYRVIGTFRNPRFPSDTSELLITGIQEQAIRTTFNFFRRIARAEVGTQLTSTFAVTGRYSFEKTKLFDEKFPPEDQPVIDRLFPEVRLSKLAGSFIFDTRDDVLDPSTGTFFILDTDLAARAMGSEVGFVRTYAQGFLYRQLSSKRRTVAAFGLRVGAAHGFEEIFDPVTLQPVSNLPASERFFAGGDTTVRGFSLDRLGNEDTLSETGFPLGGNGVVIANAELRTKLFGSIQGVGFVDAGNVYPLASDLTFTDLRPAAGFGIRINTDFGPIRLDLGFNLDPKQFSPELPRERRMVFHVSIGQAF